jgi:predicted esterase
VQPSLVDDVFAWRSLSHRGELLPGSSNLAKWNVPALLYTAEEDEVVPARLTRELAGKLQSQGKREALATVPTGGHRDAMINSGIASAIARAKALPGDG